MQILHLDSPMFPDRERVAAALAALEAQAHSLCRLEVPPADDDAAWDAMVTAILAADRVIT